ncbi:hypothetical protein P3875_04180 [Myroides sp. JBRI-B21084]|uniref:hypothetical protein n=1 Tax=Myroides sp. JBRI-B21084 TaxID=3119977 RepID=UPI0026E3AD2E|nr:hypothetical protein [Paenimyroides cloacae]WKW47270.1 hypothetical protein P3875_04180 [Paenimyroides cloacae]
MKNEIKIFIFNIAIIIVCCFTLLFTSLLLEWQFIQQFYARQMVVYCLMLIEMFIYTRILLLYNNLKI